MGGQSFWHLFVVDKCVKIMSVVLSVLSGLWPQQSKGSYQQGGNGESLAHLHLLKTSDLISAQLSTATTFHKLWLSAIIRHTATWPLQLGLARGKYGDEIASTAKDKADQCQCRIGSGDAESDGRIQSSKRFIYPSKQPNDKVSCLLPLTLF